MRSTATTATATVEVSAERRGSTMANGMPMRSTVSTEIAST